MKQWTLQLVLQHFDYFFGKTDFAHLPDRDSDDYRQMLMQTANDVMFWEGRYNNVSEYTLEIFDDPKVRHLICDLTELNRLTPGQRQRLRFFLDIKEVCYPLFRGRQVDWTAWPWQLSQPGTSLDNDELFDLITSGTRPCLYAAMLYNIKEQIWADQENYSSVARQEASDIFSHKVQRLWEQEGKDEEQMKKLAVAVNDCANDFWFIENHMQVGRLLGFDHLAQSLYDAFDTFIDRTYRHQQVRMVLELAEWVRQHWVIGERHPAQEKLTALDAKIKELMAKHHVTTPDLRYTWNIIVLDVLGASAFSEEEELDDDDEIWDE